MLKKLLLLLILYLYHLYLFTNTVLLDVANRSRLVNRNSMYATMGISLLARFTLLEFQLRQLKHDHSIIK